MSSICGNYNQNSSIGQPVPSAPSMPESKLNQAMKEIWKFAGCKANEISPSEDFRTAQPVESSNAEAVPVNAVPVSAFSPVRKNSPINLSLFADHSVNILSSKSHTTVNNVNNKEENERTRKEKNDATMRLVVGVCSFIFAVGAAAFAGKVWNDGNSLAEQAGEWEELKNRFEKERENIDLSDRNEIEKLNMTTVIIKKYDEIALNRQETAAHKFILLVSAVFASAVGFGGALAGSSVAMTAGVAIGGVVAVGAAFKAATVHFNREDAVKAGTIQTLIKSLKAL